MDRCNITTYPITAFHTFSYEHPRLSELPEFEVAKAYVHERSKSDWAQCSFYCQPILNISDSLFVVTKFVISQTNVLKSHSNTLTRVNFRGNLICAKKIC